MKIVDLTGREILDSKGQPTVEAQITLENGVMALGQVPAGASVGSGEAVELRDRDSRRYNGMGVLKAVETVKTVIKKLVVGQEAYDQTKVDKLMIEADGTENKSKLGANAILAVSFALCRAAARSKKIPFFRYFGQLSGKTNFSLPEPLMLLLEGGKHGDWSTDIQEYFIVPKKERFATFQERLQVGSEVFYSLHKLLSKKNYSTGIGLEGAFCPQEISSNEEALQLIIEAVKNAGYKIADEVVLGIDAAASQFFENGHYILKSENNKKLTPNQWLEKVVAWTEKYAIKLLEDICAEDQWQEWTRLMVKLGYDHQIIGDDLLVTQVKKIKKAIEEKAVNSVLIKPNQVGTITETLSAIDFSAKAGCKTIISHRAGETNDDLIADLAVGTRSDFCKFGGPDRGERVAKYNRLLRIEEQLMSE